MGERERERERVLKKSDMFISKTKFHFLHVSYEFRRLCIYGMAEFCNLLVLHFVTMNFSLCLVLISYLVVVRFSGNIEFFWSFFTHALANLKQSSFLLSDSDLRPVKASALL